jgi:hypothetical protein
MGNRLFREVTDLTGLPKKLISEELVTILGRVGSTPQQVTLEDLRTAMAMYLTEVIGPDMDGQNEGTETKAKREKRKPAAQRSMPSETA